MILREDILSMEYLKRAEYSGCCQGMRYRLEQASDEKGEKRLRVTVWPEPFNFFKTEDELKTSAFFDFSEEGVKKAVDWMNIRLSEDKDKWDRAFENWRGNRL